MHDSNLAFLALRFSSSFAFIALRSSFASLALRSSFVLSSRIKQKTNSEKKNWMILGMNGSSSHHVYSIDTIGISQDTCCNEKFFAGIAKENTCSITKDVFKGSSFI